MEPGGIFFLNFKKFWVGNRPQNLGTEIDPKIEYGTRPKSWDETCTQNLVRNAFCVGAPQWANFRTKFWVHVASQLLGRIPYSVLGSISVPRDQFPYPTFGTDSVLGFGTIPDQKKTKSQIHFCFFFKFSIIFGSGSVPKT